MSDDHCEVTDGCITCGDVAVALTVLEVSGADARCRDDDGRTEDVATELVDGVVVGDRLLVHAGVALERLSELSDLER
jgi:hydrogenase maturation factor